MALTEQMGELFRSKIQPGMPQGVDLGVEVTKLAQDVKWGSRCTIILIQLIID